MFSELLWRAVFFSSSVAQSHNTPVLPCTNLATWLFTWQAECEFSSPPFPVTTSFHPQRNLFHSTSSVLKIHQRSRRNWISLILCFPLLFWYNTWSSSYGVLILNHQLERGHLFHPTKAQGTPQKGRRFKGCKSYRLGVLCKYLPDKI